MVLQNELADEEIEHFDDIVEEPDKAGGPGEAVQHNDGVDDNEDDAPSEDDSGSPTPSSDDEFSDKGDDDLLGFGGLTNLQESQMKSGQAASQPQGQDAKSSLPGGYDPRHREPIYWYCRLLKRKDAHKLGLGSLKVPPKTVALNFLF